MAAFCRASRRKSRQKTAGLPPAKSQPAPAPVAARAAGAAPRAASPEEKAAVAAVASAAARMKRSGLGDEDRGEWGALSSAVDALRRPPPVSCDS